MVHVSKDRFRLSPIDDCLTHSHTAEEHRSDRRSAPNPWEPLPQSLNRIRQWADELADFGWPRFGEFAQRVESARDEFLEFALVRMETSDETTREFSAERQERIRPQVAELLEDYDRLIHQLREAELHFESWQAACRRFEDVCQCGREQSAENLQTPHAPS